MSARVLTIDIETTPNLADIWGLFNQNVGLSQLRESTRMFAFAAKFVGEKKVHFHSEHHDESQLAMVQAAHDLISEADVVVHYNGKSFDMPHLRREFLVHGLKPASPVKEVDLCLVAKKVFRFTSNKLDYVSRYLGLAGKTSHTGHDLWVRCMAGDEKAWALMKRYNVQDVRLTEQLYLELLPWIPNHPHMAMYLDGDEDLDCCPVCTSTNRTREGYALLGAGKYPRFQCKDCGKWYRGKRSVAITETRAVQ